MFNPQVFILSPAFLEKQMVRISLQKLSLISLVSYLTRKIINLCNFKKRQNVVESHTQSLPLTLYEFL